MKSCKAENCRNAVFSHLYCKIHQRLRTDAKWLKTLQALADKASKPRPPINKMSKALKRENAKYLARLPSWKKENSKCQYPGCGKNTDHCHHSRGRGRYLNEESTFIALCEEHHRWVELHPSKAKELRLSAPRLSKE